MWARSWLCGFGLAMAWLAAASHAQDPKKTQDDADDDAADAQYSTTVRGARPAAAASERSIRGEEVMNRARSTPYDFLRLVPNLIIGLHEGGGKAPQYLFRGFDADHGSDLAMYFDGIPVNEVSHVHGLGYLDPHFIVPELIERIEVQKGPYDAQNGSFATAGTIRLTTRSSLPKSEVSYSFGSFESHRALGIFSPDFGAVKGLFAVEGYGTNGFTAAGQGQRYNAFAKLGIPLGKENRLDVLGLSYGADWNAPGLIAEREVLAGRTGPFGAFNATDGGSSQRHLFALTFSRETPEGSARAQLYYMHKRLTLYHDFTGFLADPENGDQIAQQESRSNFGGEARYAFTRRVGTVRFRTELGAQWRVDDIHPQLWRTTRRARRERVYEREITTSDLSGFAKEEISFGRHVALGLGVRYDLLLYDVVDPHETLAPSPERTTATRRLAILNPKVNLVLKPHEDLHLFANFGTGFRAPDARAAIAGAFPGIARATGAEGGVRAWLADRRLEVAAVGWWMDTDRDVVFVADEGANEEVGPARRFGGELEARARILPWLWADFDLSYTRARFRETDELVPRAPRLLTAGGVQVRHPTGFFGSLRARRVGAFPLVEDGSRESQAYTVADLVLGYEAARFQVSLNVQNLFNTAWRDSEYFYASAVDPAREPAGVGDVHFRPGEPFLIIGNVKLFF
jgi:outer membrane receptor protein involved in Fe transport